MTESFLSALREFLLAEAQECYWQQAVLREASMSYFRDRTS
jgi:programmed cell death 6-interacting protein